MDGKRNQPDASFWIKAFDGLHKADVTFLNQIRMRQAVAEVLAGHGHNEPEV